MEFIGFLLCYWADSPADVWQQLSRAPRRLANRGSETRLRIGSEIRRGKSWRAAPVSGSERRILSELEDDRLIRDSHYSSVTIPNLATLRAPRPANTPTHTFFNGRVAQVLLKMGDMNALWWSGADRGVLAAWRPAD